RHTCCEGIARVCMASLPSQDSVAAVPLMFQPLVLSLASVNSERIQFDYIRGVDSAFDWVIFRQADEVSGKGWGHEAWVAFASDRVDLGRDPAIDVAACIAFAAQHAAAFSAARDASDPLWEKHRQRMPNL